MTSKTATPVPEAQVTSQFLFGLRVGVIAVVTTVLLSISIVRNPSVYRPLWVQVVVLMVFVSVIAVEAVMAFRRASWDGARWIGWGVAVAATIASCMSLPPGGAATSADWAYGVVGWILVIVLLDRPLYELVLSLALVATINLMNLVFADGVDQSSFLNFLAASIGTIGYPLAVGIAAAALRGVARKAHIAAQQTAEINAEEAIAATLHHNRQRRFTELSQTALPLLEGLASGALDPEDTEVQRACAIEAGRMRRLFAESDGVPNQLIHELRHCAEIAERKGVTVELQSQGSSADPPLAIRRALTEVPLAALATAKSWARVTLAASDELLSVNTLSDSGPFDIPGSNNQPSVQVNILRDGDTLWVETQWSTDLSSR